jgi:squalene cyclase
MTALALLALLAQEAVKSAVERAIPLLEKSNALYVKEKTCFSCHHQALPVFALAAARAKGFKVDEENLSAQLRYTAESLERGKKAYQEGRGQGGRTATAGYALWTLETGGWKADETTAAVVDFLIVDGKDKAPWSPPSNRPPSEASSFTATFLALRGLGAFGSADQKERAAERVEKARRWLVATEPKETEDRVYRLRALRQLGGDVEAARKELLATQREDGGWAQLDGAASDAYATGSALAALREAAGMACDDASYRRGVAHLVSTQKEDGTWHVATRAKPIQKYFESGFPHGKDQFISITATAWAVVALAPAAP